VVAVELSNRVAQKVAVTREVAVTLIWCGLTVIPPCVMVALEWLVRPLGQVGGLSMVVRVLHGSEEVKVSKIYSSDRKYVVEAIGLVAWAVGMQGVKPVRQ